MNICLKLFCDFESVFLVNGSLIEGGEIVFGETEVVFITVLPLEAILIPYTVKKVGSMVKSNHTLAKCYCLGGSEYHLKFVKRHNYVYGVAGETDAPKDLVERLFLSVMRKDTVGARACLSLELGDSIDDTSLLGFFDGLVDIVPHSKDSWYYLVDKNHNGALYEFALKEGLIDNIIEL